MKKLLIMMLVASLVLVSGCAGKKDKNNQKSDETKQEQSTQQQETQPQQQQETPQANEEKPQFTPETAKEVTSIDVNNMSQGDLDALVEMFNDPDSTPEQKEAARIQLEKIFKQAEANQQ